MTKVWTREALLTAAGIKPVEWPPGWYLHGEPDYQVSPKAPTVDRKRKR